MLKKTLAGIDSLVLGGSGVGAISVAGIAVAAAVAHRRAAIKR